MQLRVLIGPPEYLSQDCPCRLGAILVADSPVLDGEDTTKAVFPVHRTVSKHTRHPPLHLGESPRKPLCRASGTGGSNPPSPLHKAKNRVSRPGRQGRVLAFFGRVRGQLGGKLANRKRSETDEITRKNIPIQAHAMTRLPSSSRSPARSRPCRTYDEVRV